MLKRFCLQNNCISLLAIQLEFEPVVLGDVRLSFHDGPFISMLPSK
jgi:hypothetical protein